jgi:signal transduction histidine kinase
MPEGGKITLKAHNAGRFVALEVIDTGAGIPQQSLSNIFDLFYSTKGSSGFGLWSARTNALRNQGDLMVKSQEGCGTIFTLLLPGAER